MAISKVTAAGIDNIAAAVEGASDSNKFTDADHSKLNAIEASATADQTAAQIKAAVESASDSNTFTDADHSKLNAIEASATADQTDAQIRTAVEAASDSNVFTDADHSKLNAVEANATADQTAAQIKTALENGIDSVHYVDGSIDGAHIANDAIDSQHYAAGSINYTAYLGADVVTTSKILNDAVTADKLANSINTDIATGVTANTTANAALPKAGGTMTGNVLHNDNAKILIGTGSDLQIYHDASHSYISETGTGDLRIRGNGTGVYIQSNAAENMGTFTKDGAVELYHNNVKKIETTAAGATVTGALAVTGTVDGVDIQTLNTTAGAALPKAGGAMSGATTHADNVKDTYGTGGDLEMYHDGSASYIRDVGVGNLLLSSDGAAVILQTSQGEKCVEAVKDGTVNLYHNNVKKFETTAAGATVTGMFNLTGSSSTYSPAMNINSNTQSRAALAIQASHTSLNNANYGVLTLNTVKASGTDFDLITAYTGDYGAKVFDVRGDGAVTATSFAGSGASLTGLTSAQMPAGSVLQVVSVTSTTQFSTTALALTNTGINLAITPTSSSSKILVIISASVAGGSSGFPAIGIRRDSTDIALGLSAGNRRRVSMSVGSTIEGNNIAGVSITHLDSPATTSAVTYRITLSTRDNTASYTAFINRTSNYTNGAHTANPVSTITLMEIGV